MWIHSPNTLVQEDQVTNPSRDGRSLRFDVAHQEVENRRPIGLETKRPREEIYPSGSQYSCFRLKEADARRIDLVPGGSCLGEFHRDVNTRSCSETCPSLLGTTRLYGRWRRAAISALGLDYGRDLCAGSRDRYSFGVVASNTVHANGPPPLSSSDLGNDTGILPKMRCRRVGENVECTLAQNLVGPICRLGRVCTVDHMRTMGDGPLGSQGRLPRQL